MSARLRTGRHAGSTPVGKANTGCSSAGRAPRLGRGGRRIVTCHPDQRPLSLNGRALRSERGYGGSIPPRGANGCGPERTKWRNGNGAVCKAVMSRLDTAYTSMRRRLRMARRPPSCRAHGSHSSADRAPDFQSGGRRFDSFCDHQIRRVGRAARHRGANATRPSGRAGSTPALSANLRVWHRWMCIGLPNRPGEIVTRGPLQFAPLVYRLESRSFKPKKRARHPYGAPIAGMREW
jgi:hypothetical protein